MVHELGFGIELTGLVSLAEAMNDQLKIDVAEDVVENLWREVLGCTSGD